MISLSYREQGYSEEDTSTQCLPALLSTCGVVDPWSSVLEVEAEALLGDLDLDFLDLCLLLLSCSTSSTKNGKTTNRVRPKGFDTFIPVGNTLL